MNVYGTKQLTSLEELDLDLISVPLSEVSASLNTYMRASTDFVPFRVLFVPCIAPTFKMALHMQSKAPHLRSSQYLI